jgi:hypothetical protein
MAANSSPGLGPKTANGSGLIRNESLIYAPTFAQKKMYYLVKVYFNNDLILQSNSNVASKAYCLPDFGLNFGRAQTTEWM